MAAGPVTGIGGTGLSTERVRPASRYAGRLEIRRGYFRPVRRGLIGAVPAAVRAWLATERSQPARDPQGVDPQGQVRMRSSGLPKLRA